MEELVAYEQDGSMLVLGEEKALRDFDRALVEGEHSTGIRVSSAAAARLGAASEVTATAMANSGRWLKVTPETAEAIKAFGNNGTGVLKAANGQFSHVMRFEAVGLLTPAAPAVLASLAAQYAAQQQAKEMQDALDRIEQQVAKLDRHQRAREVGALHGAEQTLDEATRIYDEVGHLSDVTWSKIAGLPAALLNAQGAALEQVRLVTMELSSHLRYGEDQRKAVDRVHDEVGHQLMMLALASKLQSQVAVLELARVQAEEPDQLDSHRRGLELADEQRRDAVEQQLLPLLARLSQLHADVPRTEYLHHLRRTRGFLGRLQSISELLSDFADARHISTINPLAADQRDRSAVASEIVGEARELVDEGAARATDTARQVSHATQGAARSIADSVTGVTTVGRGRAASILRGAARRLAPDEEPAALNGIREDPAPTATE